MAQMSKYVFNTSGANIATPTSNLPASGWAEYQILTSSDLNAYMNQASNWAGDFKSIATITSDTFTLPDTDVCNLFDLIILQYTAGPCTVNFNLSVIGTGPLSIGQIITLYNNSWRYSFYQINGDSSTNQIIGPYEQVELLILDSTTLVNLTDKKNYLPPGSISYRLNNLPQRGWLNFTVNTSLPAATIGNATSGATFASNSYEGLFIGLWMTWGDIIMPVTGGRGASGYDDFQASKRIDASIILNKYLSTPNAVNMPGSNYGASTVTLSTANLPAHTHEIDQSLVAEGGSGRFATGGNGQSLTNPVETTSVGSGNPFSILPPTFVPYVFLKL